MGENIELVVPDRGEHARGDRVGIEPRRDLPGDFGHHRRCRTGGIERLRLAVAPGPVAPTLADAGADKTWTQHADADAERLELMAKAFGHADHGKLARPVGAESQ